MNLSLATKDGISTPDHTPDASPLKIAGLTVSYGQKPAVFSVDMTVEPGSMTAIIGPNGAGKSTLLKAALGIIKPLSGHVRVFGEPLQSAQIRT